MPEKEPTQKTPQGYEIPVPTREQVLGDLAKAAQPKRVSEAESEAESDDTEPGPYSRPFR